MDLKDDTRSGGTRYVVGVPDDFTPRGLLRVLSSMDHCDDGLDHVIHSVEGPDGRRTYVSAGDVRPATPGELLSLVLPAAPAVGDLVMPTGTVLWADRRLPKIPHTVFAVEDYRQVTGDPGACALVIGGVDTSSAYVSLAEVTPFRDQRVKPVIQFDHSILGVSAECKDCGAHIGRCSEEETQLWADDHEDLCPVVIDAAHAEAMRVEVDAAHAEADAIRHKASAAYWSVTSAYRHWSRLTAAEQAAWMRWAVGEVVEQPVIDAEADDIEVAAVALWAAAPDGTTFPAALDQVIAQRTGACASTTVVRVPVFGTVRTVRCQLAAGHPGKHVTASLVDHDRIVWDSAGEQTAARSVTVELIDAVEVPESDGTAMQWGPDQRVAAYTALGEPVVDLLDERMSLADAQQLLRELASAVQWHTDRGVRVELLGAVA